MSIQTTLVFDIETVPDLEGGRRIHDLQGMNDGEVAAAMRSLRMAAKGNDFQPAHLQRIVAISVSLRQGDSFRCWSLGEESSDEAELVRRFFDGIEKYRPVIVSWNGGGFDLPVLHYRALINGVQAPRYWDTGHFDREAKWDNYLGRYQFRHTDLMDVLAMYTGRQNAPLHEIALLLGLPGKLGLDGSMVFDAFQAGKLAEIRAYCETDVLNTWLVYLRFQFMRGLLDTAGLAQEIERVKEFLRASTAPHWQEFLEAWNKG
ncbi:3'-5' exonuclease [Solimonas sp. K1W22B-7]|uniref:3'-5' exonuclease n=1 Tax=Solimonas sp. K1W22B-7 TaxID=2303331 RepID=UPI001969A328|nr:3'-5' exonuclease [Solimonas sp. K1W22B-7]